MKVQKLSPLQEWYGERSILLTGGTGFMGKVLLEKLIRDLPTLEKIYLLVRPKRGLTPEKRLEAIKKLPVFNRLNETNPSALDKICIIEGSLSDENLGIADSDIKRICNDVSVVFHMAASLRLEAGVKDAVLANTLGAQRVFELCKKMKKLVSVVHLSTAFCHVEVEVLEEHVYKPHVDPYEIIKMVQTESDEALDKMQAELIKPHPNCYTFSKRLAEWVAHDYAKTLPLAIARPSIVTPALDEPVPGWVDSLNGPVGILVAGGKGVLRSMLCNENYHAEVIPVDIAINALISAAWLLGTGKSKTIFDDTPVFNITASRDIVNLTWGEVLKRGKMAVYDTPFEWMLWYPDGTCRTNWYTHWLIVILFQWIPAILFDGLFFIIRKERFMIRVQKKLTVGLEVLQYFTLNEWKFKNERTMYLSKAISPEDLNIFKMSNVEFEVDQYLSTVIIGTRKYCMKEDLKTLPYSRMHLKVLYALHIFCKYYFLYLLTSFVFKFFGASHLLTLSYWFMPETSSRFEGMPAI